MGEAVDVAALEGELQLPGWPGLGAVDALVAIDLPKQFESRQLAGLAAPYRLRTEDSRLVLDFPGRELRLIRGAAHEEPLAASFVARTDEHCADDPRARISPRHVADVLVGSELARPAIDTGAGTTGVKRAAAAGAALSRKRAVRENQTASAGGTFTVGEVRTTVEVGDVRRELDVAITPGARGECPYDGVLGMDLLKDCVLTLNLEATAVLCPALVSPASEGQAR